MRWPIYLQATVRKDAERRSATRLNSHANMMARFVNAARRHDQASESDGIDELQSAIESKDSDPANHTLGVAAHVEAGLLLARHGRITEAEDALDRPLRLILDQLRTTPGTPAQGGLVEACLLYAAAGYVECQAARYALASAVGAWGFLMVVPPPTDASGANFVFEHMREQLKISAERGYRAVINSKASWNYAKATNRPDLQVFALERLEVALRVTDDQPNADMVAAYRGRFGDHPRRQWIIEPETWSF